MAVLSGVVRKLLERVVVEGRGVAEGAAAASLVRLGVAAGGAPVHLSEGERALRRGLRARGRQLGDGLEKAGGGDGDARVRCPLLVAEVAYEQWHRILFARFLEVNGLLRHPEFGVAVSLEECGQLAPELGEVDGARTGCRQRGCLRGGRNPSPR